MDTTKIHSTSTNNHKNLKIFELKPPENEGILSNKSFQISKTLKEL